MNKNILDADEESKLKSISTKELSFTIDAVNEYKKYLLKEFEKENVSESNIRSQRVVLDKFIKFVDDYFWGEIYEYLLDTNYYLR